MTVHIEKRWNDHGEPIDVVEMLCGKVALVSDPDGELLTPDDDFVPPPGFYNATCQECLEAWASGAPRLRSSKPAMVIEKPTDDSTRPIEPNGNE